MPLFLLAAPFVLLWDLAVWLYELIAPLAPIIGIAIGVISLLAAVLSVIVLAVAARVLVRSERRWVRVVGRIVVALEILASLAFVGISAIAFAAVAIYA